MGDLEGVELARPGTWPASTGKTEFTVEHLRDAAEFFEATGGQAVPISLGHGDDRFSGEPAFGSVTNIRYVEDDRGPALLGDIVDMPQWLAAAAPQRWPNRSIEGWENFEYEGRTYRMVLSGLALLGVAPPAVRNIKSLRDLQQALAASAAHRIVATAPSTDPSEPFDNGGVLRPGWTEFSGAEPIVAVSDKPWSDFTEADYTPAQYRRACLVDTGMGDMDSKDRYKLPVREPGGALNRNGVHAAAAALAGARGGMKLTAEQKTKAARALARLYSELGEEPPESLRRIAASSNPTEEGAGPMDPAKIREALGLAAAASDDEVKSALASAGLGTSPPSPDPDPAPENPPAPAAAPAPKPALVNASGTMQVDVAAWEEREQRLTRLEAQAAEGRKKERDQIIAQAVTEGKFPPARKEFWVRLWDADPEGTRQVIDSLAKNVMPVMASGYAGDIEDDEAFDAEFAHLFPPSRKGA